MSEKQTKTTKKKVEKPKEKEKKSKKKVEKKTEKKVKVRVTIPHRYKDKHYKVGVVKVNPKEAERLLRYFAKKV